MPAKRATQPRSSAAPRRNGAEGEDSELRSRLVEAAVGLFTQKSYQSVTVAEIGRAANVTGPALYRHFASKEALLAAALHVIGERLVDDAQQILAEAESPEIALKRLLQTFARAAVVEKSRMVMGYFSEGAHLSTADRKKLDERYRRYVGVISDVLATVSPGLRDEERSLRVQAAMWMINSSPYYVSGLHEATLMDTLVDLALKMMV